MGNSRILSNTFFFRPSKNGTMVYSSKILVFCEINYKNVTLDTQKILTMKRKSFITGWQSKTNALLITMKESRCGVNSTKSYWVQDPESILENRILDSRALESPRWHALCDAIVEKYGAPK